MVRMQSKTNYIEEVSEVLSSIYYRDLVKTSLEIIEILCMQC